MVNRLREFGPDALQNLVPEPSGLPPSVVRELVAAGRLTTYSPGEVLVRIGERCDPGAVVAGLLSQTIRSEDGRRATLRYVRKGESFAVESVFRPMSHMVRAVKESRVAHYDRLVIEQQMGKHPSLALKIAERLAVCTKEMDEAAASYAFMTVGQRVVVHLAEMAERAVEGERTFVARLSQQELADAVGSVREVVSRVLRELKEQGIIETSRSGIVISDETSLLRFGREAFHARASDPARN